MNYDLYYSKSPIDNNYPIHKNVVNTYKHENSKKRGKNCKKIRIYFNTIYYGERRDHVEGSRYT